MFKLPHATLQETVSCECRTLTPAAFLAIFAELVLPCASMRYWEVEHVMRDSVHVSGGVLEKLSKCAVKLAVVSEGAA